MRAASLVCRLPPFGTLQCHASAGKAQRRNVTTAACKSSSSCRRLRPSAPSSVTKSSRYIACPSQSVTPEPLGHERRAVSGLPLPPTFPAMPSACVLHDVCIAIVVASTAPELHTLSGSGNRRRAGSSLADAVPRIVGRRADKQMGRVDAWRVVTVMARVHTRQHRSSGQLKGDMRGIAQPPLHPELTV